MQSKMGNTKRHATLVVVTTNAEETEALGYSIGQFIGMNLVIALKGNLGAGKTTLTRGIVAGLGIGARVTSPTFTLVNEYDDAAVLNRLIHVDTYRLDEDPAVALGEVGTIGIDDLLDEISEVSANGITLLAIEWAERIAPLLPDDHLEIRLDHTDPPSNQRKITLNAWGGHSAAVVNYLSTASTVGCPADR
jgi:tRNA threonylcarbamoyladenosine biosynthesis protein TsaE